MIREQWGNKGKFYVLNTSEVGIKAQNFKLQHSQDFNKRIIYTAGILLRLRYVFICHIISNSGNVDTI